VQRTPADNGLAVVVYAPVNATVPSVGGGARIDIDTRYPFEDLVRLRVSCKTSFPLHLRIPAWVASASVSLNGATASPATPGTFHVLTAGPGETLVELVRKRVFCDAI
jgi:DUF1680 family protein